MKKLFVILSLCLFLTSCAGFNAAMDIASIFVEQKPIHYAEVESVMRGIDYDTVYFVDKNSFVIHKNRFIDPGDMTKIFANDDGTFKAESD